MRKEPIITRSRNREWSNAERTFTRQTAVSIAIVSKFAPITRRMISSATGGRVAARHGITFSSGQRCSGKCGWDRTWRISARARPLHRPVLHPLQPLLPEHRQARQRILPARLSHPRSHQLLLRQPRSKLLLLEHNNNPRPPRQQLRPQLLKPPRLPSRILPPRAHRLQQRPWYLVVRLRQRRLQVLLRRRPEQWAQMRFLPVRIPEYRACLRPGRKSQPHHGLCK